MLFKALALIVIFFLVRNTYRSWILFQKMQESAQKKKTNKSSKDDAIDAEYTVVDK